MNCSVLGKSLKLGNQTKKKESRGKEGEEGSRKKREKGRAYPADTQAYSSRPLVGWP